MHDKIRILKIDLSKVDYQDALEEVRKWLKEGVKKHYIVTPNPEILVTAQKNANLQKILNEADLALPDGIGLLWASRLLGRPLKERVTGTDFMQKLCELAEKEGFSVGLIGGKNGVAVKTVECLKKRYPKLRVVLAQEEWKEESALRSGVSNFSDTDYDGSCRASPPSDVLPPSADAGARWGTTLGLSSGRRPARATRRLVLDGNNLTMEQSNNLPASASSQAMQAGEPVDILFVAFGAPKQEIWINQNLANLPVRLAVGVGGAFDYFAGVVPRAPKWIQNLGLEWLFRLICQPWRIKRQLALWTFIFLILKEKIIPPRS